METLMLMAGLAACGIVTWWMVRSDGAASIADQKSLLRMTPEDDQQRGRRRFHESSEPTGPRDRA